MNTNADDRQDKQVEEMTAFLAKRGVPPQDCALAEQYLCGTAGDEVLGRFRQFDFASMTITYDVRSELDNIMKGLKRSEKRAACVRLLNVLFAIGHGSCSALLYRKVFEDTQECALYKRIVVFIEHDTEYTGYLRTYGLQELMDMAQGNPGTLRETLGQLREEGAKYYLTALAVYFCMKYKTVRPIEEEDAALMRAYEDGILDGMDAWLAQHGCAVHQEILAAIRARQLVPGLLDGARQCRFVEPARRQLCFLGGMAYLNFMLSDLLLDAVRTCLAVDAEWVLCAIAEVSSGTPDTNRKIRSRGGDYDALFWIAPETYIRWAAVEGYTVILQRQLEKNQDSYLRAMDESGFTTVLAKKNQSGDRVLSVINQMKDVMLKGNPDLYSRTTTAENCDRAIDYLVRDTAHADLARAYLRGQGSVSALYPCVEEFSGTYVSYYRLREYVRHGVDEAFFNRCQTFMALICSDNTRFVEAAAKNEEEETAQVEQFFRMLDGEQLDIAHQLGCFAASYKAYDTQRGCGTEPFVAGAVNAFGRYLDGARRQETLAAFSGARAEGRYLALLVLKRDAAQNRQEILGYAADSSKLVREELLNILCAHRDWEDAIQALLLEAKKAAQRELAAQVLSRWQQEGGSYGAILRQALAREKNAKVLVLLQDALNIQESDRQEETPSKEELVKQLHRGNRKKSLAWAYEKPFPPVHKTDGTVAEEAYLQAILLCYASQEKNGVSKNAMLLADDLQAAEFAVYVNELFDRWLAAGAESQKRWVLYAASVHGGGDMIQKLQRQLQEWPKEARGAIAAEAVRALALNPSPRALLIVDGIARKFKFRQVRAAAGDALAFAASELGITREELSDRIVPDLGFDENMERTFDYGGRVFRVTLTPALAVEVSDENGKRLKSLPVPGNKDDADRAAAAYEDFKQMKKQIKTAAASQKARLEYALAAKRAWGVAAWTDLFVRNPLMHQFAIGLIWGVYEEDQLVQSFRYMEDGSFNTQDGEEYVLPGGARISLVHPIELSDADRAAWKEQLDDYEITQPIEQLGRTVYYMTDDEADKKRLERFGGYIVNNLSLSGKLTGAGWYRGSVQDAGGYNTYYREDAEAGMGVELHFSGAYVGLQDEDVTVYDVRFYRAGTVARGSYVYDEADDRKAFFLRDVPPRYFSEIVLQLAAATASSEDRDEGWRREAGLE